jgi:hypothetical protein
VNAPMIVIPVSVGLRNEPLRYVVRAWLAQHADAEIILVGGKPAWWRGRHVHTEQLSTPRGVQWTHNFPVAMLTALDLGLGSFWWSADDIFPFEPLPAEPVTWCRPLDLDTYLSKWRRQVGRVPDYTRMFVDGMRSQRDVLRALGVKGELPNADMHMPHHVTDERLGELIDTFQHQFPEHPIGHWRAVYGGLWPGELVRMQDPKVAPGKRWDSSLGWVSTSPGTWTRGVGREIQKRLTTPSPWEADQPREARR